MKNNRLFTLLALMMIFAAGCTKPDEPNLVSGSYNGYDFVDLGLPSGTLWAICNVGADTPEGYGDYFAWGETTPKDTYDWNTYRHFNYSFNQFTKYCSNSNLGYNGFTDDLTTLEPIDDAATANWGDGWRTPTQAEWQELLDNTNGTLTNQNGVKGWMLTAANGNSLFLPSAGCRLNSDFCDAGDLSYYWSSSLYITNPFCARYIYFNSSDIHMDGHDRFFGQSVRAVRSAK